MRNTWVEPELRRPASLMVTEYGAKRDLAVVVHRLRSGAGTGFGLHRHDDHQLVVPEQAALRLRVGDEVWTVGPGQAGWIPAGHEHDVVAVADTVLTCVHLEPPEADGPADAVRQPGVLAGSTLLRSLVDLLAGPSLADHLAVLAAGVLLDVVTTASRQRMALSVPRSPAARMVARTLLCDPADPRSLRDWAAQTIVSERTLQRAFVADTGLGFREWRNELRLASARALLTQGRKVHEVAQQVGFAGTPGFVAAYRRRHGVPPGHHRASADAQELPRLGGPLETVAPGLLGVPALGA